MKEYNLSFEEALKYVVKGDGWVQGENYAKGVILRLNCYTKSVEVHCFVSNSDFPLQINKNCYNQNYKIVRTQVAAMKKETNL